MDGDVELPDLELASEPLVVVVGSEGKGLSRLVREHCDQIVSVPMSSAVESLNAGIATGVTLYEVARRRRDRLRPGVGGADAGGQAGESQSQPGMLRSTPKTSAAIAMPTGTHAGTAGAAEPWRRR